MGTRLRAILALAVILLVGALAGSAWSQWYGAGAGVAPLEGARARERIRVEVLNAGGLSGAAREATEQLRDHGFDVVFFGNAGEFGRDSSLVLDRVGHLQGARDVADALGIRNVRSEPDSNLYLDVSVVLGMDWAPASTAAAVSDSTAHAWWDPRGWLRR